MQPFHGGEYYTRRADDDGRTWAVMSKGTPLNGSSLGLCALCALCALCGCGRPLLHTRTKTVNGYAPRSNALW